MRTRILATSTFLALGLIGGVAVLAQRPATPPRPVLEPVSPETPALPPPSADPSPPLEPVPAPRLAEPPAQDDPMQAVDAFVERNRKEAEESIQSLTREAEALRARLQKVEAALRRWKAVEQALTQAPAEAGPGEGALPPPLTPDRPEAPAELPPPVSIP